ncbi:MAG: hypothetical protein ACRDD7_15240 [Peptostreptococcaceae bacterium]
MAKMVSISFKDNEMDLYEYLKGKSSPSIYIKDMLRSEARKGDKGDNVKDDIKNDKTVDDDKGVKEKEKDKEVPQPQNTINLSSIMSVVR